MEAKAVVVAMAVKEEVNLSLSKPVSASRADKPMMQRRAEKKGRGAKGGNLMRHCNNERSEGLGGWGWGVKMKAVEKKRFEGGEPEA